MTMTNLWRNQCSGKPIGTVDKLETEVLPGIEAICMEDTFMKRGMAMLVRVVFHHSIFANGVADVSNFSISILKPSLSFVYPETVQVAQCNHLLEL